MKTALGKGLGALIQEKEKTSGILELDINAIIPNEHQPRRVFNDNSLRDLASSIKEKGVIQPVIVRKTAENSFVLIAGERRWRAAKTAGLKKIPVIIKDAAPAEALELALIENIQRE
ncbi:MAG: ParB/RepB/Spo0J family partition protein, partial [Thermodesulfovibrionia bacterium]|nr:ParB/RepB/Spo0J family partition protein [Thermodesulfovibrionia bacterium]